MRALLPVVAVLALAACHRNTAEVTLDADADLRNAAQAKIAADLAAADAAARAPMPRAPTPATHSPRPAAVANEDATDADAAGGNDVD